MKPFFSRTLSLKKSKLILFQGHRQYLKYKNKLTAIQRMEIEKLIMTLQKAIMEKDREKADLLANELQGFIKKDLKKPFIRRCFDFVFALAFALVVAVIVRSMWFELYEIPSGSMRPSFKENDRLIVSKTDFGLNIPMMVDHFYFDPNLIHRNGVVVFTVENMDVKDGGTIYFYLFPGKKQYIKRLIGKPGDTLYFYGGKIYGIDKEENDISKELQLASLDKIDHIPFITFEGKVEAEKTNYSGIFTPVKLYQMNEPIAELSLNASFRPEGKMLTPGIKDYGDVWGFKNYAMSRLLTKEEVLKIDKMNPTEEAPLYLELKHSPSVATATFAQDPMGRMRPMLGLTTSIIPLTTEELKTLFHNLYTARFIVKNGFAFRYGSEGMPTAIMPKLNVPDGTYEFQGGEAYRVVWGGITTPLPPDHPLYQFSPQNLQLLFNLGIDFNNHFVPSAKISLSPNRYAYFREGDLYVMGAPLLKRDNPTLTTFLNRDKTFIDPGAPTNLDGSLNIAMVKQYGLKIPDKMYLTLGDNHAMSADSREYGFLPEDNLRGAPDFIFWPPGSRFGKPNQPPYALITTPRVIVWGLFVVFLILYSRHRRKKYKLPLSL